MQDSSSNQLILWYTNYSPYPNVSYAGYTAFASIGTPGPVFFNYGGTPTSTTTANVNNLFVVMDGTLTLPCYVEVVDTSNPSVQSPPYITNYQSLQGQYTTPGSSNRYPGEYSTNGSAQTFTATSNSGSFVNTNCQFENMYPDCSYSFYVKAKNGGNSNYGNANEPSYTYSTIPPSYPPTILPSSLFNTNNYIYANQGYFVSNNNLVSSQILNINKFTTSLQSNNIITPVQKSGVYGKNSVSVSSLNVTASIVHNSQTTNPSVIVSSFGIDSSFTNTLGGINVTAKTFDAYYNGGDYNKGFYLDCSTNMTITQNYFSSFTTNNKLYQAQLTCTNNGVNPTSSYSFYADNVSSSPSFNSISGFTINSNSDNYYYSNQVSGIWVLNQTKNPFFSVTNLKLNNMGDYFYASPLVTYTITDGVNGSQSETNRNNVTNISGEQFVNPITITNNSLTGSVLSSYKINISLSIKFNNLYGEGSQNNFASINVICDQPSYNLITNTLATTIQNLGTLTSGKPGYRVWSANVDSGIPGGGTMTPSGIVPYVFINNGATIPDGTPTGSTTSTSNKGYINVSYNNVWNISSNSNTNQELLIANGNFTTNNTYYKNYTTFNGNGNLNSGYDYSGLSGKKYATFAWNVSSITNVNYLNFVINFGTTNLYYSNTNSAWYFNQSFTDLLELYYRFEYNSNVNQWGQYQNGNYYATTTWITINKQIGSTYSIVNVTNQANSDNVYNISGSLISPTGSQTSGNVTFKISIPTIYLGDPNVATLYLRIGIPSGYNTFSNVLAYVTAT
jgi:hypothetical protein